MAPLTKEPIQSASSEQTASQQPKPQPKPGSLSRSDAVSLEIPVKVHGSRVTAVIRDLTPQTEPFEEETSTMIVFPQGCVLRMTTVVSAGQMLVLTNLKSRQDAICRVVKVRSFPNMQSYVEVEFTQPQAKYWGVYFPSEGGAGKRDTAVRPATVPAAKPIAPAVPPASVPAHKTPSPSAKISAYSKELSVVKPSAAPAAPIKAKAHSPFATIGTKEEIQPAAATTAGANSPSTAEKRGYAQQQPKTDVALNLSLAPVTDSHLPAQAAATTTVDEQAHSASEPVTKASTLGVETIASSDVFASVENDAPAKEDAAFGARLDTSIGARAAQPQQNWLLIAACIALLLGAVAVGVWYFRSKADANNSEPTSSAPAPNSSDNDVTRTSSSPEPLPSSITPNSPMSPAKADFNENQPPSPAGDSPATPASPAEHASLTKSNAPTESLRKPAAEAPSPERRLFAEKLKAHPLSSSREVETETPAPALDPAAGVTAQSGDLLGIGAPAAVPLPPGMATQPAPGVGGVKEPRLISSVLPVYPSAAKQAHVEGDVVIDAHIDTKGNVARMDVVSGPAMLRQAALDALHRWKYQPSQADGQPIEQDVVVKIKFRL